MDMRRVNSNMEKQELNIILMGPPASGKGTQSELICKQYNIPHISTGDMFRTAISMKTELGLEASKYIKEGLLVPDEVTISLVKERLHAVDCKKGFLLDGFPRTVAQADSLEELLASENRHLSLVILLVADEDELISRITDRRVCTYCGASYNLKTKKPKIDGVCDICSHQLVQRADDRAESFKVRLDDYKKKTLPLVEYYRKKGLLKEIPALNDIQTVFQDIQKSIASI